MKLRCLCYTFCSLLVFVFPASTTLAHVDKEQLKKYKKAKKYYFASDYESAKAILLSLIDGGEKNTTTPYALFYYALSAYHNGELSLAEDTFSTILEEYPDWEQEDEVNYWLGQLRFEAEDYHTGLTWLAKITNQKLGTALEAMKVYFLRQVDNIRVLQNIAKQYPDDRTIASVLSEKVAQHFCFDLQGYDSLKETVSLKKDSYNVGIFFPFFIDDVDYEEENNHLFVLALYQGIKVAVTALAHQGIKINLFAYDTKKDPVVTAALLEQEEVKGMDLMIGPLYAATFPLVADFARIHRVNLFNPISENQDVVGGNSFVFLFKSSLETQARRAAEFTLQNATKEFNVGIVYGTSEADAIQARTYKQYVEHHTGKAVAFMVPATPEGAQASLNEWEKHAEGVIGEAEEGATKKLLSLEGLTHLYVASKNELIVAHVLRNVELSKQPPCIIGHESWICHSSLTFDQIKRHRLFFVAPNYIDYKKADLVDQSTIYTFRRDFYNHFAQYPTTYACTGYEMMLFLGHMLDQYGVYFQKHWAKECYHGNIFEDVIYGMHHDNQCVPIIQFQKNKFVVCNRTQHKEAE